MVVKIFLQWKTGGSGSKNSYGGSGRTSSGRGGSDAPSWRKPNVEKGGKELREMKKGEEDEVTSLLKEPSRRVPGGHAKKLHFDVGDGSRKELDNENEANMGKENNMVIETVGARDGRLGEKEDGSVADTWMVVVGDPSVVAAGAGVIAKGVKVVAWEKELVAGGGLPGERNRL